MSAYTTLANVQQYLGLNAGTDDALLTRLITACSRAIDTTLNRSPLTAPRTATLDGNGRQLLPFPDTPATAVASVSIDGVAIPPAPDTTSPGYRFDATRLVLQGPLAFSKGRANVRIEYTAGYATDSPEAAVLEQLCIETVALKYKQKDFVGYASKALAGETVSFVQQDFPPAVRSLLQNFKRVAPG